MLNSVRYWTARSKNSASNFLRLSHQISKDARCLIMRSSSLLGVVKNSCGMVPVAASSGMLVAVLLFLRVEVRLAICLMSIVSFWEIFFSFYNYIKFGWCLKIQGRDCASVSKGYSFIIPF